MADDRALATEGKASIGVDPVNVEALRLLQEEISKNPNILGATRARRLATLKRPVLREWHGRNRKP